MKDTRPGTSHLPTGQGPLADAEPATGRPIDDPSLADRANPRWADPAAPRPDAQPLANPDGTPNVMPPEHQELPTERDPDAEEGTPQDQAARPIEAEPGRDNLREGRGGGTPNPSLAEGGDSG